MDNKTNNTPTLATDMDVLAQAMNLVKTGKADQLAAAIQHVQDQEKKPHDHPQDTPGVTKTPGFIRELMEKFPGKVIIGGSIPVGCGGSLAREAFAEMRDRLFGNPCDGCHDGCCSCHGDDEEDEYDEDNIYDRLEEAGIENIFNAMISMPTVYGRLLMMRPNKTAEEWSDYTYPAGWSVTTASIEDGNVIIDVNEEGNWLVFLDEANEKAYDAAVNAKFNRFVFPIVFEDIKKDNNLGGTIVRNRYSVAPTANSMYYSGLADFKFPHMAFSVTKPGMICNGMEYCMDTYFVFHDEPTLDDQEREQGILFIENAETMRNWSASFNPNDEVYRVQLSNVTSIENGLGVAGSILYAEMIDWSDLCSDADLSD